MGLVVRSQVKEMLSGYNISKDLFEKLDSAVVDLVNEAKFRAEGNGRKTVMARDV